jgi:oxygen-dependent protoporphyrinogen oxidase
VIRGDDGRWALEVVDRARDAAVPTPLYDGVIVAAPAPRAARMLAPLDGELAALLGNIDYASSVVVNLGYRPQQLAAPLGGFGFVVPEIEGLDIVAASFPSVKFAHRGGSDLTPVRVFLGGAKRPEVSAWDDAQLVAAARRDLEPLIQASGPPVHTEVVRWPESMPQYHVGHVTLVDSIFARLVRWDGLQLAGNAYRGVGIPQCVQSGWDAAERLAPSLVQGG